jgi:hypothetical protein
MHMPAIKRAITEDGSMANAGYDHRVRSNRYNNYTISWSFNVNPQGSCTMFTRTMTKDVDEASAIKFAKKHNTPSFVVIPEEMKDADYCQCREYVRSVRGW